MKWELWGSDKSLTHWRDSLSVGAWVSRNCSSTSWKTGRVAVEREPDDTEPFSSTTSESPHLCSRHNTTHNAHWKVEKVQLFHVTLRNPVGCVCWIYLQETSAQFFYWIFVKCILLLHWDKNGRVFVFLEKKMRYIKCYCRLCLHLFVHCDCFVLLLKGYISTTWLVFVILN